MVNSFSTQVPKQFKGGRAVFKINGTRTSGYAFNKWTPMPQHMQKLSHDDLNECKI